MVKRFLFLLFSFFFSAYRNQPAMAMPYEYRIFTWDNGVWSSYGSGEGDSPVNINPNSHASINLGLRSPNDTYGAAFVNGSATDLLISHTYDDHHTEWIGAGTLSGGPGNSDFNSIGASHVGAGTLAGNYLYLSVNGENMLNVYRDTGDANYQYVATEPVIGGPATAGFDEIGVEWIGGPYNASFLYRHDTQQQAMQVYRWQEGTWYWIATESILGTNGTEEWSNFSVLWDGERTYLSVAQAPVPEPASGALFGIGAGVLGLLRRRRV